MANVHVGGVTAGSIVSFTYETKSRHDVPTNVQVYRIRADVVWDDVVYSFFKEQHFLNAASRAEEFTALPQGYWTQRNIRTYMEQFARSRGMDPLSADSWTNSYKAFQRTVNGRKILKKLKKGYYNAVQKIFPEITVDPFTLSRSSWHKLENRRVFFERYAKMHDFDPQKPKNWYSHSQRILSVKGLQRLLTYHDNSLPRALADLFPNIGIDPSKFPVGQALWSYSENRRILFENYAKVHGFDPLVPEEWYIQARDKILSAKDMRTAISFHNNSIPKALLELFPEIGLDVAGFKVRQTLWRKKENRRNFFETYATDNNFDPLVPENWYLQSRSKILSVKGARGVLLYHHNSVAKALLDLFPSIGLVKTKFCFKSSWSKIDDRQRFFESYAKKCNFDPRIPLNWYTQAKEKLMSCKGAKTVMSYYDGSLRKALLELFPNIGLDKEKFKARQSQWRKRSNRVKFFEQYAKENRFDHLQAENWYSQSRSKIMSTKGTSVVLSYHKNSLPQALQDLFPSVGIDITKFTSRMVLWHTIESRRRFFENYAKTSGFDLLNPICWYARSRDSIMDVKGARMVLSYYGNSISKALLDLFPDIGLDVSKFRIYQSLWRKVENRRSFFENFARQHAFDPRIAENWYKVPKDKIMAVKGARSVMAYHGHSFSRALLDLFPNIGLDKFKFHVRKFVWDSAANRKKYFMSYALSCTFDPLTPEGWYANSCVNKFYHTKGAQVILSYHQGSFSCALLDLFPDIGLDPQFLTTQPD